MNEPLTDCCGAPFGHPDSDLCSACHEHADIAVGSPGTDPEDDPWGNAYGSPMYWIPPEGDEYWTVRNDCPKAWTHADETLYWDNRLGDTHV
jgi:hypothetical protein